MPRVIPTWILAAALFAVTVLVYAPTLHNGFIDYDDPGYITANPHVTRGLTLDNVRWAFTTFEQGNWHPITWLSHQLDASLFGLNPVGHHAISIVFHAINAVILFLLLARGTKAPLRSFMVAALIALHPINVETVAWAAERKSLLCMFFSLLTVWMYYRRLCHLRRSDYILMHVVFALALTSKPMAVTLPVLLLLFELWPLRWYYPVYETWPHAIRMHLREKLGLFAMSLVSAIVTIIAQRHGGAVSGLIHLPLWVRLENATVALGGYLRHLVILNDFRYFYPHRGLHIPAAQFFIALGIVAVTIALVVLARRRVVTVGALFFLVALLPVLGLLQVGLQSMADRYAYLPFIGLFTAIVWTADEFISAPAIKAATALTVLAALSFFTIRTERYWHDSVTLFQRASDLTSPPNLYIETNLAAALVDQHRTADALVHFRRAEEVAPQVFAPHFNIGLISLGLHDHQTAIDEFRKAAACDTSQQNRAIALFQLANSYAAAGDRQSAIGFYQELQDRYGPNPEIQQRIDALRK